MTPGFEARVGAWFAGEGRQRISDRKHLRQMNMALALALSRWLEFAESEDAIPAMREWLDDVEASAVARGAAARAEAIRQAREWFEACEREGSG